MPWHCPACQALIRHSDMEERPRPRQIYRCHICRLDLTFDAQIQKLTIAPLDSEAQPTHSAE